MTLMLRHPATGDPVTTKIEEADMDNVDQRLVDLCRRDEIIALRDRAKRAAERGDEQAAFVWAWMEQELSRQSPGQSLR